MTNTRTGIVDQVIYGSAYLHFGRINGIGIPCRGPGICDVDNEAVWARCSDRARGPWS